MVIRDLVVIDGKRMADARDTLVYAMDFEADVRWRNVTGQLIYDRSKVRVARVRASHTSLLPGTSTPASEHLASICHPNEDPATKLRPERIRSVYMDSNDLDLTSTAIAISLVSRSG